MQPVCIDELRVFRLCLPRKYLAARDTPAKPMFEISINIRKIEKRQLARELVLSGCQDYSARGSRFLRHCYHS